METGEGAGWNRGRSCLPPQTPAAPACRGLSVHDSCLSPAIRVREWRFLIQASRGGTHIHHPCLWGHPVCAPSWLVWRLVMPASVALKVTWPADVQPLPPTVTRSVLATQASSVEAMDD